jgi:hypothetical protein
MDSLEAVIGLASEAAVVNEDAPLIPSSATCMLPGHKHGGGLNSSWP